MSSSAISAAKRRTETALKNYKIPTTSDRNEPPQNTVNDQVLLALLQSRINWSTNVFIKYRPDAEQQPKRNNVIRRRFPMMRELGQATLELGPHLFYETSFYEAIRSDSWVALGKAAGVDGLEAYEPKPPPLDLPLKVEDDTQQQQQQTLNDDKNNLTTQTNTISPTIKKSIANELDTTDTISPVAAADTNDVVMQDATAGSAPNDQGTIDRLVYKDIVIEFKDQPSERYLFPKDVIMQVLDDAMTTKFSFMLPLDRTCADCFFWDANKKLEYFGHQSSIPEIKAKSTPPITRTDKQTYQPVNIRLINASPVILAALHSTIHDPERVRTKMISQMQKVPNRSYLDYSLPKSEKQAITELVHRVQTQPDITSGPIAAEKKRNEIGLAIKLGKRPETDQHEAEPPKTKQNIAGKGDGFRRCVYCSTRNTVMWRRGPAGEGTLCNGCGILWLQGKVLVGAPVISKEEERQQRKEKWRIAQRQRELEEWHWKQQQIKDEQEAAIKEEQEAAHRMELCLKAKKKRTEASYRPNIEKIAGPPPPPPTHFITAPPAFANMTTAPEEMKPYAFAPPPNGNHAGAALGMVAAQIAHQQHQKDQLENGNSNTQMVPPNAQLNPQPSASNSPSAPASPSSSTAAAGQSSSQPSSYHIFDLPQIPLPTLCIEFSHNTMFSHPHCTVALSHQKQFSIQLTKDNVPITFHIPRQALATTTQFEVLGQLDSAGRDILLMSCTPEDIGQGPGVPLEAFGSTLYDPKDPQRRLNVRFLEKIDALGGPVVKKILECWLAGK